MKMNHYLNVPGLLRRFAKIGLALLLVLSVGIWGGAGGVVAGPGRLDTTTPAPPWRRAAPAHMRELFQSGI